MNDTNKEDKTKPETSCSGRVETVVSGELVQAEYDGYIAYHTYTMYENNPHEGEKGERWALGFRKARVHE